ncbi:RASD family member 3 [Callorhinchus milii]|uniref:RASD family member 3 n=1 Tax=Callorhinchus milii TaxID=7868 RepID=V9L961_CALMI|nr:RASD family member 3 [Callorhinchus milii]|eukprot:gi/632974975/ref/XP_007903970.1/ PREDICTED: ras-related protein Rap-2c-like [Callorhinchus milii]
MSMVVEKQRVRLVFLGSAGVGKTALVQRFLGNTFDPRHRRTVEELHCLQCQTDSSQGWVEIMDTSGSYSFPAMRQLCIRHGDVFALVYSAEEPESFEEIKRLREQILAVKQDQPSTPMVVVANKADLAQDRLGSAQDMIAAMVQLDWGCSFLETSAKHNHNVLTLFKELLLQVQLPSMLRSTLDRRRDTFPRESQPRPIGSKSHSCAIS